MKEQYSRKRKGLEVEEDDARRKQKRKSVLEIVGKFRPQLIELTSFKPKLLIRFIMNKTF